MKAQLNSLSNGLVRVLQTVAGIALFGMIGVTLADILCRHLLGFSISGVVDGVEFLFVWMVFPAIAIAFFVGAHISVDIIDLGLSDRAKSALMILNNLIGIIVVGWLFWLAAVEFLDKYDWGDRTIDLKIPLTWFWGAVVLGFAFSIVGLILRIVAPLPPAPGPKPE